MLRAVRAIRKEVERSLAHREILRDAEGRAIVSMRVRDDETFLSPFSCEAAETLSSEVAEYLEKGVTALPPGERIAVQVYADCIDEEEKPRYRRAIATYFTDRYAENRLSLRRNTWAALWMLLVGVALLGVMWGVSALGASDVFIEVVDIFAWVFIWEAVDVWFLTCSSIRFEQRRYLSLIEGEIRFLPLAAQGDLPECVG